MHSSLSSGDRIDIAEVKQSFCVEVSLNYTRTHAHTHTYTHIHNERIFLSSQVIIHCAVLLLCFVFILAKSFHCFHTELVYFVSRGQQTVMFVNTLRVYKRPNFSLRLEKNFDARPVGRVLIHGSYSRIYSVIRTQNKAEVSI